MLLLLLFKFNLFMVLTEEMLLLLFLLFSLPRQFVQVGSRGVRIRSLQPTCKCSMDGQRRIENDEGVDKTQPQIIERTAFRAFTATYRYS